MRKRARLELERLDDGAANKRRRREHRRRDLRLAYTGQRDKARARGEPQKRDENRSRLRCACERRSAARACAR